MPHMVVVDCSFPGFARRRPGTFPSRDGTHEPGTMPVRYVAKGLDAPPQVESPHRGRLRVLWRLPEEKTNTKAEEIQMARFAAT